MVNDPNSKDCKGDNNTITEKREDITVVSEELIRWMTEGTHINYVPRSDCV